MMMVSFFYILFQLILLATLSGLHYYPYIQMKKNGSSERLTAQLPARKWQSVDLNLSLFDFKNNTHYHLTLHPKGVMVEFSSRLF